MVLCGPPGVLKQPFDQFFDPSLFWGVYFQQKPFFHHSRIFVSFGITCLPKLCSGPMALQAAALARPNGIASSSCPMALQAVFS